MIGIKEKQLETLLFEALERANKLNKPQFVSLTKKINKRNPLHFFQAAKQLEENRSFWANTKDDFYIIGVGIAKKIIAQESRFEETKKQWDELIEDSVIYDPYDVLASGIVALGGMSFDPEKTPSGLWDKYADSEFTVPSYTLIKDKDNYYFTTTTVINKNDEIENRLADIEAKEQILLHQRVVSPGGMAIVRKDEIEREAWKKSVHAARETIRNEQAKKIVLAREVRLKLDKPVEVSSVLANLLEMQSGSYVFAFEHDGDCFVGATPERLVKVKNKSVLSTCLAGTAPRGKTKADDEKIKQDLFFDKKNREEHNYVVKMIRNKLTKDCTTIDIPEEPTVCQLKNLHHLYTPVQAVLKSGSDLLDIIKQLHPTPALGGVPREASLAFIREHEALDRGWYGAPIGWMDHQQNGEFAVAIRSGLIKGDEASVFAGCGVMRDSDVEAEYEETNVKLLPMLSALEARK